MQYGILIFEEKLGRKMSGCVRYGTGTWKIAYNYLSKFKPDFEIWNGMHSYNIYVRTKNPHTVFTLERL